MSRILSVIRYGSLAVVLSCGIAQGAPLIAPGNPILPIDTDPTAVTPGTSSYPGAENPPKAIDGLGNTKYLNFGRENTGFIVTPFNYNNFNVSATFTVQSFRISTANDAEARDPASYQLWGTLDPITTPDNSNVAHLENWVLICSGPLALPAARNTAGPLVSCPANIEPYESYRMVFPTVKNGPATNSMQFAEVQFFDSLNQAMLTPGDPIRAFDLPVLTPASSSPGGEQAPNAIDANANTKYLNFGEVNSGFIVSPLPGPSIVNSFTITTANDAPERDPSAYSLFGTNDPITSAAHSQGTNESWTLVSSGTIDLPTTRFTAGTPVSFANGTAYSSYKMVFTNVRNSATANSMQIADIQFDGQVVPEPSTLALGLMGLGGVVLAWRRKRSS